MRTKLRLLFFEGKTRIRKGMVQSDVKLNGKTTLITGCNTGIGYETALDFSSRGARVIMACRNLEKAEEAKTKVNHEFFCALYR